MNFNKLPKDKRNRLVLVAIITLVAVAGLYFGLVQPQNENLGRLADKKAASAKKLQTVLDAIRRADAIKTGLDDAHKALAVAERDVAAGDLYAWVINSLRDFKAPYSVDIPQFSQLGPAVDVNLLPNFPYKQATMTIAGSGHFHDVGRFISDFENRFPHVRLLNFTLDSNAGSQSTEPETLSFKMDIVTLVKVNPS